MGIVTLTVKQAVAIFKSPLFFPLSMRSTTSWGQTKPNIMRLKGGLCAVVHDVHNSHRHLRGIEFPVNNPKRL